MHLRPLFGCLQARNFPSNYSQIGISSPVIVDRLGPIIEMAASNGGVVLGTRFALRRSISLRVVLPGVVLQRAGRLTPSSDRHWSGPPLFGHAGDRRDRLNVQHRPPRGLQPQLHPAAHQPDAVFVGYETLPVSVQLLGLAINQPMLWEDQRLHRCHFHSSYE